MSLYVLVLLSILLIDIEVCLAAAELQLSTVLNTTTSAGRDQDKSASTLASSPASYEEEKCEALVLYKTKTIYIPEPVVKKVPKIVHVPVYVRVPVKVPKIVHVPYKVEKYVENHHQHQASYASEPSNQEAMVQGPTASSTSAPPADQVWQLNRYNTNDQHQPHSI